jgi:general secretion pathway protein D
MSRPVLPATSPAPSAVAPGAAAPVAAVSAVSPAAATAPALAKYQESLKLKDAKLFKVIEIYSQLTGINVFVDDTVKDRPITLSVTDLPIDRVLDLILLTNSLLKKQVSAKVAIIYPPAKEATYQEKTRARVFSLQHKTPQEISTLVRPAFPKTTMLPDEKTRSLVVFADEQALAELAPLIARLDRKQLPIEREVFVLEHLDPAAAVPYLQGICPTIKTFVDARIRTLTVYAPPEDLVEMRSMLARLDRPPSQVAVEVKLLDVDRGKLKELGIALTQGVFTSSELSKYSVQNLPLALSTLINSGSTRVLAAPRLQLLNQKKASILIGDKIPLELKTAAQTAQGSINLATTVQYTNVGIQLDVEVLQIHPTQEVTLALVFDVSSVVSFSPAGYPRTSNRNANSVVRLHDGETIVLGGLLNNSEQTSLAKMPLVGDLPLIGSLFRRERSEILTREIVMTVTPRLIEEQLDAVRSADKPPLPRVIPPAEAVKAPVREPAPKSRRRFDRLLRSKGISR